MYQKEWQKKTVLEIKLEAQRVLKRIEEYERSGNFSQYNNHQISAIKRATLDFNKTAVKLRKGFHKE
jgi:hypothetical protein